MESGRFESQEIELVTPLMRCSDVFIDVGANIGYYTCLARSLGCQTVVSIEPLPGNLKYLYGNIIANEWEKQIEVWPVGLSDRSELCTIYSEGTGASLIKGWAGSSELMRETISVNTLDKIARSRFVDKQIFIKVDIEGIEYEALNGAMNLLKQDIKPRWLVEITFKEHRGRRLNSKFIETFDIFFENGYLAYSVHENLTPLVRSDVERYLINENDSRFRTNYLFISKSDRVLEILQIGKFYNYNV